MTDDFVSLFAFNRWANDKMLDACRKLTPEQYAAEPVPGWASVPTVYHIAVVTDGWLRTSPTTRTRTSRAKPILPRWTTPPASWPAPTRRWIDCCPR